MAEDSTEVDRRLEAAKTEAVRAEQTQDFLRSLTADTELVRPVYNPEAYVFREKARGAAERGEIQRTDCKHPFQYLQQFEDSDPSVMRKGNSVNLFECQICTMLLWLVDPFGKDKSDV